MAIAFNHSSEFCNFTIILLVARRNELSIHSINVSLDNIFKFKNYHTALSWLNQKSETKTQKIQILDFVDGRIFCLRIQIKIALMEILLQFIRSECLPLPESG